MNRHLVALLPFGLAALLAACSAGAPPVPGWPSPASKSVRATVRVKFPRPKPGHVSRRDPRYVSASTKSVTFTLASVDGGSVPHGYVASVTVSLAYQGSNSTCTYSSGSQSYTCATSWTVPAALDAFSVKAYDGTGGTGNQLSANAITKSVSTGSSTIAVTLEGIPASVEVQAVGGTLGGSSGSGFTVSKCFTSAQMQVLGLDADGNAIIGAGAPASSLSSGDTSHIAVATPGPTSSPGTFTLSRPSLPVPRSSVGLTASVAPGSGSGGSVKNLSVSVSFNSDICGVSTEYKSGITGSFIFDITSGADGNLWVTQDTSPGIYRVTTAGVINEYTAGITASSEPYGITSGPDGNLWFTQPRVGEIAKITTAGTVTEYSTGITFGGWPLHITSGPDGNLWFTECSGNRIGKITTAGAVTEYSTGITSGAEPWGIAAGPDGNLWFTEYGLSRVAKITTAGAVTEYSTGISSSVEPSGIAKGPDGNLWFTEFTGKRIAKITTAGAVTEYASSLAYPPSAIVAAPDGNLWFTEQALKIGKVTTAGAVTEYSTGISSSAQPWGITVGPDNFIWFTEYQGAVARAQ